VACAVPGIMAARVIENRRDRLATILVAPLMSCSARLPVYLLLLGAFLSPEHGFAWWVPGVTLFAMYAIGIIVAPLMAYLLKSTLLRGATPVFVMEMPLYRVPSVKMVGRRAWDAGVMFVRRAGTIILASMIVVWALLYFPATDANGTFYDVAIDKLENSIKDKREEKKDLEKQLKDKQGDVELQAQLKALDEVIEPVEKNIHDLESEWKGQSYLGRMGKAIEPVVRPLGWDWRIGMAAVASFPAREVMVGTMGLIFKQGSGDSGDETYRRELGNNLRETKWDDDPGRDLFTVPVALSVMVFFALCCQCASTLAVIRRETNSWEWPVFTFVYMTALAYLGALATYQIGSWLF